MSQYNPRRGPPTQMGPSANQWFMATDVYQAHAVPVVQHQQPAYPRAGYGAKSAPQYQPEASGLPSYAPPPGAISERSARRRQNSQNRLMQGQMSQTATHQPSPRGSRRASQGTGGGASSRRRRRTHDGGAGVAASSPRVPPQSEVHDKHLSQRDQVSNAIGSMYAAGTTGGIGAPQPRLEAPQLAGPNRSDRARRRRERRRQRQIEQARERGEEPPAEEQLTQVYVPDPVASVGMEARHEEIQFGDEHDFTAQSYIKNLVVEAHAPHQAADEFEISFGVGDRVVMIFGEDGDNLWYGDDASGRSGWFPASKVDPVY